MCWGWHGMGVVETMQQDIPDPLTAAEMQSTQVAEIAKGVVKGVVIMRMMLKMINLAHTLQQPPPPQAMKGRGKHTRGKQTALLLDGSEGGIVKD